MTLGELSRESSNRVEHLWLFFIILKAQDRKVRRLRKNYSQHCLIISQAAQAPAVRWSSYAITVMAEL